MPFLILFLSFLLCLSKATLTYPPIDQSDEDYSSSTNLNVLKDLSAKDLELFLKKHYSKVGYPLFSFLSELKDAINKDPPRPHSLEVIFKVNESYALNPIVFMMIIKALDDEELVLHVCLMLKKFKIYEGYKRSLKECYLEHSYKILPEVKIKVIFHRFDRMIHFWMKKPFPFRPIGQRTWF
jgi:hypothetical protein